jgi:hypothetical protein
MPVSVPTTDAFLSKKYPLESLKKMLIPAAQWKPYPTAADRSAWEALPDTVRKAHLAYGEQALAREWPRLAATNYLKFARVGNRDQYEAPNFARRDILGTLVIAECVEGRGRFLDAITDAVWSICEETSWVLPAHIYAQRATSGLPDTSEPVVDLFNAETAALVSWTVYLVGEQLQSVSPLIVPRLEREIQARMLIPNMERDDFWWMGFRERRVNNWNPWINSNWLTCALLIEKDEARRAAAVDKILRSLDRFVVPYPRDGGCDEGPGYWSRAGASLFENLELLHSATAGKLDEYSDPLIQNIGRYEYRAHIADNFYLNFADAAAVLRPDPILVFNYGRRIADEKMTAFGAWLAQSANLLQIGARTEKDISPSLGRVLPALFGVKDLPGHAAQPPLVRDVFLNEIEVMVARDHEGRSQGLYVAAKGGHNAESHNHNDIGNFVTYIDGKPVIIDVGVETYSRKTFSPQRYEIWTMQSGYHSLPTINGVTQAPGETFAARDVQYSADETSAQFSLDIAGAYPAEAGLKSWRRTVTLRRGQAVEVVDRYEAKQKPASLTLNLITPCKVDASQPGSLALGQAPLAGNTVSGAGMVEYDPAQFSVAVEEIDVTDGRLLGIWGSRLYRLVFSARDPQSSGSWKITIRQ